MPARLRDHGVVTPKNRTNRASPWPMAVFFPNEVARCLAIDEIDYAQLRGFYRLIRNPSGSAAGDEAIGRGWARFSLTDMACLLVALELSGGPAALQPGRHLTRTDLVRASASLHAQGYPVPLLNVRMERVGRRLVAVVDGVALDPSNGQTLIDDVARRADRYFDGDLLRDPEFAATLKAEVRKHRAEGTRP